MDNKPAGQSTSIEGNHVHIENEAPESCGPETEVYEQRVCLKAWIVITAVVGTYFATIVHTIGSGLLGNSIVAVIGGRDQIAWLTMGLLIQQITLGPAVAQAADYWGRKIFVIVAILCGTVGCIVVSRSQSIGVAITGQIIGGFAGTAQPLTHAITSETLPRKYRPLAQAAVSTSIALAGIVAVYVGSAFCNTDPSGFRNFFHFTATLYFASACVIAIFYHPPIRELQHLQFREKLGRIDGPGTFLISSSLLLICLALTWSNNPYGWGNAHILTPFIIGIALAFVLVLYAVKFKKDGILHHGLFQRSRNFAIAELCLFIDGFAFFAQVNYFSYQVSLIYGKDLLQTANVYGVTWYVFLVSNLAAGYFCARKKSVQLALTASLACYVLYFGCMAGKGFSSISNVYGFEVFGGIGLGVSMTVLIVTAQLAVPPELIATASALMITTRSVGGIIAIAIYNAIFNSAVNANLAPDVSKAAISQGLPPTSVPALIQALLANNEEMVLRVPGINMRIVGASVAAFKSAFHIAFQNVYIAAAAFAFAGVSFSLSLKSQSHEFTHIIEAPLTVETKEKVPA